MTDITFIAITTTGGAEWHRQAGLTFKAGI